MDNTQLTPLRKRNSKISRRLSAAIEKAMGIDPADRFQNADEFKRALLGSKSKTQRLPGEYTIEPPPPDEGSASDARSSSENGLAALVGLRDEEPSEELPVFKPPKKRKKGRLLPTVLIVLLLLAAGLVGFVRFLPNLVPPVVMGVIPQPLLSALGVPATAIPTATQSVIAPVEVTAVNGASEITATPTEMPTETVVPTNTLPPVVEVTSTPNSTPIPVATSQGGGSQIAFASARSGVPQIYLVNLDGTGLTPLTNITDGACQPTWSPDGSQIAFISPCLSRGDVTENTYRDSSIYVMNADGSGQKPLTVVPGSDFDPDWSPDGKRIVFTSLRDGKKDIYVLTIESGAITRLTSVSGDIQESSQPTWSPFGNQIVYTVKRVNAYQIWAMSDTGQGNVQIARSGQQYIDYLPIWAPDNSTILFSQRDTSGASRAWLMSIRYEERETKSPTRIDIPRPVEDVEFSPDGLWIVFEGMDNDGNRDIYFMTASGGSRTRLTTDPGVDFDPAWRPTVP